MKLVQYQRPGIFWPTYGRLADLQTELDRLFSAPVSAWAPALDVQEDKDSYSVRVELPGLKREEIEVSLEEGVLTIAGERKAEALAEGAEVLRQERFQGKFARVLTLPAAVIADKVVATHKDGVLTVSLPKAETAKPRQISVTGN